MLVAVEGSRELEVSDTGELLGELQQLAEEVEAVFLDGQFIHLQMPRGMCLPVADPSVDIDVDILFGGGY